MMRAFIVGLLLSAQGVLAQVIPCNDREVIADNLTNNFDEHRLGAGMRSETIIVEVWASLESGTFTVLFTDVTGLSCVLATGINWTNFDPTPEGDLN